MVSMRIVPGGFERLRTLMQAVTLTEGDKKGPLLVEMDRTHRRQTVQAFKTEGASTGLAWQKLSPRYAEWKRKVKPGRRILVFSGDMKERYTGAGANHIRRFIRPFTYAFGVISDKAWRHETGTGEGKQRLPRRSVLHKSAADLREFVETLKQFYVKRLQQATRHL